MHHPCHQNWPDIIFFTFQNNNVAAAAFVYVLLWPDLDSYQKSKFKHPIC